MAQINVNRDQVRLVRTDLEGSTFGPAAQAVDEGRYIRQNAAGKYAHGGGAGGGIAYSRAIRANYTVSVIKRGLLELGDALQAIPVNTDVFANPADGTLHDATGVDFVKVGSVEGHFLENRSVPRRLLRVNV